MTEQTGLIRLGHGYGIAPLNILEIGDNNMLFSLQADKSVSRQVEFSTNACKLSIRDVSEADIEKISGYFLKSDPDFLIHIGIDPKKVPFKIEFSSALMTEIKSEPRQKTSCHLIWELNNIAIGHSNINKIIFSSQACLHIHIWEPEQRNIGNGTQLVKDSVSYFFKAFNLKQLYCEPYALNPAPNKILKKIGFEFMNFFEKTPDFMNYNQPVNQWMITQDKWQHNCP